VKSAKPKRQFFETFISQLSVLRSLLSSSSGTDVLAIYFEFKHFTFNLSHFTGFIPLRLTK